VDQHRVGGKAGRPRRHAGGGRGWRKRSREDEEGEAWKEDAVKVADVDAVGVARKEKSAEVARKEKTVGVTCSPYRVTRHAIGGSLKPWPTDTETLLPLAHK
jgi:hypothetical protein